MAKDSFHNGPPTDLPPGAPRDAVRVEFARRLQRAMVDKGWNQSELSRRASHHLPKDKPMGRDSVSSYVRARHFPTPSHLAALAKALDVEPDTLVPARGVASVDNSNPPLAMHEVGDGRVWLRVNMALELSTALKIMNLINQEQGR
jgi:transcriptional regulator with XRE-family HTH domain